MRHDLSRQLRVLVLITASSVAQQTNTAATSPPRVEETIIVTGTYEASPLKASDRTVEVIDIGKSAGVDHIGLMTPKIMAGQ